MKLDWNRGQFAGVADCGQFTASTWREFGHSDWNFQIYGDGGPLVPKGVATACNSMEDAEKLAESWLERNDRPAWHDVTDWLSWAEWRGVKLCVRPECGTRDTSYFQATDANRYTHYSNDTLKTVDEAKSAAEKWVREQGA